MFLNQNSGFTMQRIRLEFSSLVRFRFMLPSERLLAARLPDDADLLTAKEFGVLYDVLVMRFWHPEQEHYNDEEMMRILNYLPQGASKFIPDRLIGCLELLSFGWANATGDVADAIEQAMLKVKEMEIQRRASRQLLRPADSPAPHDELLRPASESQEESPETLLRAAHSNL